MKPTTRNLTLWVCAVLTIGLTSCATHIYSQLQSDFAEQVERDNLRSASPFFEDDLSAPAADYEKIADRLSESYITSEVPEQLVPNAWMLRAISLWRSGKFMEADQAAKKGQGLAQVKGSREDVILRMVPGLAIDQQTREQWADKPISSIASDDFEALKIEQNYALAMDKLTDAKSAVNPSITPEAAKDFLHYHRWRVLQNWRLAITRIDNSDARREARNRAKAYLGSSLTDAIGMEKEAISPGNPYRKLIQAQERG